MQVCVCAGVQNGMRAAEGSKPVSLQPWLLGLTAVVGFLLLVFIILVIQRLLKKRFVLGEKKRKKVRPLLQYEISCSKIECKQSLLYKQ